MRYRLVPEEPTERQIDEAFHETAKSAYDGDPAAICAGAYRAMLASAPVFEPSDACVRNVAVAICKSRTCEGIDCCQWPANCGRLKCNASLGAYDDAARAAIEAFQKAVAEEPERAGRSGAG